MSEIKLKVLPRSGKSNKATEIAAEFYGPGSKNQHLTVARHDFEKVFEAAASSLPVTLEFNDKSTTKVIIREVQREPLKNKIVHVDLMCLDPKKAVIVEVELEPTGKSNAIANMGGMLEKNLSKLKIKCLADHLVKTLKVDLSKLVDLKSVIRVEDLVAPEGVTIKNNPRDVVYSIAASRRQRSGEAKTESAPAAKAPAKGAKK